MTKAVIRLTMLAALAGTAACSGNGTSASTSPTPTAPSATTRSAPPPFSSTAAPSVSTLGSGHPGEAKHDDGFELEGLITSLDVTARSMVVGNATVMIPATAVIRHGETMRRLADLKVGQRVHVRGTRSGANLVALEIIVQDDHEGEPDRVSISGQVSKLAGTCPVVTFTVDKVSVSTTSTTKFSDGTCAELANGVTAHVTGQRRGDGSVVALHVSFEDDDIEGAEVEGAVASLQGSCPAITFMIGTTKVSTDATTRFRGGPCSQIANGTRIEATGTAQAPGSLQAASVTFEDESDDRESD